MARKRFDGNTALQEDRGGSPMALERILGAALKARGIDKDIERYRFVTRWSEIVGPDIALRARPECLRNKTLYVRVVNSAWAQELSFQKDVILRRMQRFIPKDEVLEEVVFLVGR